MTDTFPRIYFFLMLAITIMVSGCQSNPVVVPVADARSPEFEVLRANAEIAGKMGEVAEILVRDKWGKLVWSKSDKLEDVGVYVDSSTGVTMSVVKGTSYEYYGEAVDADFDRFGCRYTYDQSKARNIYKNRVCGQHKAGKLYGWNTYREQGKIHFFEYHNGRKNGPSLTCQCLDRQCSAPVNCIEGWYSEDRQTIDHARRYPLPPLLDIEADFSNLARIDPMPEVRKLVQEEKFADAENYLSYFIGYDYVQDDPEANQWLKEIHDTRGSWQQRLKEFNKGLLLGKGDGLEGEAASMLSEMLVVGDLRDILKETWGKIRGEEADNVVLALATIGVATVAIPPIKSGISFVKAGAKVGALPKWLAEWVIETAKTFNPRKINQDVPEFFLKLKELHKTVGTRATLELLSKSKDRQDFLRLASFGNKFGQQTSTLLKVAGDDAIIIFDRIGNPSKAAFLDASTYGREGILALEKYKEPVFHVFKRITKLEREFISSGVKARVAGREFIKRNSLFNPKYVDAAGRSNIDRMKEGLAPTGADKLPINLHHMKQKNDGLLVELSDTEHKMNFEILHRYRTTSEIDRDEFNVLRSQYWKERALDFE